MNTNEMMIIRLKAKKGQNAHGYLPSKPALEKQIREIESGEAEAVLEIQIQKLEEQPLDFMWQDFLKKIIYARLL